VSGADITATDWASWSLQDEGGMHYYVRGHCPACAAPAQGHARDTASGPIEGQGKKGAAPPQPVTGVDTIEVPVECTCGYGHGNPDAASCGRQWTLILSTGTS
jgi:hypothetical protein